MAKTFLGSAWIALTVLPAALACGADESIAPPNLEATVQARVEATVLSLPSATPTPTPTSTPVPSPTPSAKPTPTPEPTQRPPIVVQSITTVPRAASEYVARATEFIKDETAIQLRMNNLGFPNDPSSTWSELLSQVLTDWGSLVAEWNVLEPPQAFEGYHVLQANILREGLAAALEMNRWAASESPADRIDVLTQIDLHMAALARARGSATQAFEAASKAVVEEAEGEPRSLTLETVIEWTGHGNKRTEPFAIDLAPWIISWGLQGGEFGGLLQVSVYRVGDDIPVQFAVNTSTDGVDTTFVYETGTFYLDINAIGDWAIQVSAAREE